MVNNLQGNTTPILVQLSERPASVGIMAGQLGAPLKPLEHHVTMVSRLLRGVPHLGPIKPMGFFSVWIHVSCWTEFIARYAHDGENFVCIYIFL